MQESLTRRNLLSLHPATYTDTSMVRNAGVEPRSSVEQGADAVVHVATSPELAASTGLFFNGKQQMRANAAAYDAKVRGDLRELSLRLVQRWLE